MRLFRRSTIPSTVSKGVFPPIDLMLVREESGLIERAKRDGESNVPESYAVTESDVEVDIREKCEQQLLGYEATLHNIRHEYESQINTIVGRWQVNEVENEATALVDDVVANGKKHFGPIDASANQLKRLSNELLAYRTEHRLLSRLPVCLDVWRAMLLLILWFVVELVVTAFLLKESGGLAMVLVISSIYCFLNCLFPFLASPYSRTINYRVRRHSARTGGWILLFTVFAIGVWLNLLMGHYRSAALALGSTNQAGLDVETLRNLVESVNNTGVEAWSNLINSPLNITDTFSWLLAVAGLVAFVLSYIEGFVRDDVYPRYGALYRRFNNQLETYDEEVDDLIDILKSEREEGVKNIDYRKRQLAEDLGRIPKIKLRIQMTESNFESAYIMLDRAFSGLVDEYRRINRKFRSNQVPAYFDIPARLRDRCPLKTNLLSESIDVQAKTMVDTLSDFSNRLHSEFKVLTARVRSSSDVLIEDPLQISTNST